MQGITHLAIGCVAGSLMSSVMHTDPILTEVICGLGSLVVDIDARSSLINKFIFKGDAKTRNLTKLLVGILLIFSYKLQVEGISTYKNFFLYLGVLIILSIMSTKVSYRFSLLGGIQKVERHRTIFHDPAIGILLFCVIPFFVFKIGNIHIFIPFLVGVLLHYIADSFTAYGLPFYLTNSRLRMPIHYDSKNLIAEYIIASIILFALLTIQNCGIKILS